MYSVVPLPAIHYFITAPGALLLVNVAAWLEGKQRYLAPLRVTAVSHVGRDCQTARTAFGATGTCMVPTRPSDGLPGAAERVTVGAVRTHARGLHAAKPLLDTTWERKVQRPDGSRLQRKELPGFAVANLSIVA